MQPRRRSGKEPRAHASQARGGSSPSSAAPIPEVVGELLVVRSLARPQIVDDRAFGNRVEPEERGGRRVGARHLGALPGPVPQQRLARRRLGRRYGRRRACIVVAARRPRPIPQQRRQLVHVARVRLGPRPVPHGVGVRHARLHVGDALLGSHREHLLIGRPLPEVHLVAVAVDVVDLLLECPVPHVVRLALRVAHLVVLLELDGLELAPRRVRRGLHQRINIRPVHRVVVSLRGQEGQDVLHRSLRGHRPQIVVVDFESAGLVVVVLERVKLHRQHLKLLHGG
mmetsp:Transcript_46969/g.130488  ORF Transcript_46969/g.130488 Transcript_46969/m.130488 type:complete len:284 (-) Transcript_46969:65-916(-)